MNKNIVLIALLGIVALIAIAVLVLGGSKGEQQAPQEEPQQKATEEMMPSANQATMPQEKPVEKSGMMLDSGADTKEKSAKEMNMDEVVHEKAKEQALAHYEEELEKAQKAYEEAMMVADKKDSDVLREAAEKKLERAKMEAKEHYEEERDAAMKGSTMEMDNE